MRAAASTAKGHEAGMKLKKQNVSMISLPRLEWLIKSKVHFLKKLAIQGASNGRFAGRRGSRISVPTFQVVHQHAGVMDMLRYHTFTIGWNGRGLRPQRRETKAELKRCIVLADPKHQAGGEYPAVLITTADHDDRVVPAHSFKYAAAMQAEQGGGQSDVIRIDTKSGHGASSTTNNWNSIRIFSFMFITWASA